MLSFSIAIHAEANHLLIVLPSPPFKKILNVFKSLSHVVRKQLHDFSIPTERNCVIILSNKI